MFNTIMGLNFDKNNIHISNFDNYFFNLSSNFEEANLSDNYQISEFNNGLSNSKISISKSTYNNDINNVNVSINENNNFLKLDDTSLENINDNVRYASSLSEDSTLKINNSDINKTSGIDKLYIPKPFNASASNIYNGLPWFLDYVHLSFWFFFISTVISILFIIYFFTFVWNNQESKYPIRETRGFSRAQTGDTMTAIIPMTWSVTMLLHASTHSNNFDENTTGTYFCLTVIAYQWGWNYYYPKDIIGIFNSTAKKVGHNNLDYFNVYDNFYDTLLNISRNQILNKNLLLGVGSSKIGKSNVQSLQSLFFKPFGYNQNLELPSALFVNLNMKKNNFRLQELTSEIKQYIQQQDDSLFNYTYNNNDVFYINFMNINTLNNSNFNTYSLHLYNKFNILNFYKNLKYKFMLKSLELNIFFYNTINFSEILNQSQMPNMLSKQYSSNNILKLKLVDSHRNKNTFFSNSNKLYLVYKSLVEEFRRPLGNSNKLKFLEEITLRQQMVDSIKWHLDDSMFYNTLSLEDYNIYSLMHIDVFCESINQWLLNNNYNYYFSNNQDYWINNLIPNSLNINFDYLFFSKNKNLNFNDSFQNTFFIFNNVKNIFNFKNIFQSFLYFSSDNSYLFYNNSILSFEDFGFNSASAIKEFWYKNLIFSNYFTFNVINFFKIYNKNSYFNLNKFLFKLDYSKNNYKFWEIDNNILLTQNNFFNNNTYIDSNIQLVNNTFLYNWPAFISNFNKSYKNIFIDNMSILNLLNYNYYSSRANYLLIKDLFIFNKFSDTRNLLFINSRSNKNKLLSNNLFLNFKNNNNFNLSNNNYFNFKFSALNLKLNIKKNSLNVNTKFNNYDIIYHNSTSNYSNNQFIVRNNFEYNNYLTFEKLDNKSTLIGLNMNNSLLFNSFNYNNVSLVLVFKKLNDIKSYLNSISSIFFWDLFFKKNFNDTSVNLNKAIRVSLKFNDPLNFNFKLSSDISNIYFNNKYLFSWQMNWTNQVKLNNAPLYKFYRGNMEKKFISGFEDSNNINSKYTNDYKFENYKISILKNFTDPSKNFKYWANVKKHYNLDMSYSVILDFEKSFFTKNFLHNLPNVNDDLDVDFVLKYLNFDINTSRRNDHLSKFKVFWGPLFTKYMKKLVLSNSKDVKLLDTLNIKNINFFKNFSINLLKFDSFYIQNISLQKNYFFTSLKVFSKYSNLKINFLKNNFFWNFNKNLVSSLQEVKFLYNMLNSDKLLDNSWFFYKNNLTSNFLNNTNFLNYWSSLWFFKDNLQNFSNKIFFNKNFKDNSDLLNKIYVITSFREKEFKNIYLDGNSSTFSIDNSSLLIKDFSSVLSLYQNFFDIKNNSILGDSNQLFLFSNLNLFKFFSNHADSLFIDKFKLLYYNYYILQLQKSGKSRFDFKEINNNISNVRRLRVSKGICLPSDISIHIICASKDVIHSWAIPGLGIKIDCIPGFNSHRRVLFRWRGLYWGQCMEVCGRYHHWMPILIRIIHKDLFLIWCLSYLRLLNNKNFKYEKYFFDEILLSNWLSDSNNSVYLQNFFKTILDKNNPELKLLFIETLVSSDN